MTCPTRNEVTSFDFSNKDRVLCKSFLQYVVKSSMATVLSVERTKGKI